MTEKEIKLRERYEAKRKAIVETMNKTGVKSMSGDEAAKLLPDKPEWEKK